MSRYSIIHLALADLPVVFQELARVLKPGGTLLIWFNGTDDPSEHGEHFDHTVATAFRHDPDILSGLLAQAGLTEQSRDLRKPGEGERPFPQFAITATKVRRR